MEQTGKQPFTQDRYLDSQHQACERNLEIFLKFVGLSVNRAINGTIHG
jgi:hypothetical protein